MIRSRSIALFSSLALCSGVCASPTIGDSEAGGDVTLLASYEVPAEEGQAFEAAAGLAARRTEERGGNFWLLYEEHSNAPADGTARFFTVHFPHDLDELTEPGSASFDLVEAVGDHRIHAELTRQVSDWCSTTRLDADKLQYAYVDYWWLTPGSLHDVGRLMARRGEILRSVFGTTSDGSSAAEGFVAMVAPFQVMQVLFSTEPTREQALRVLAADLAAHGVLADWDAADQALKTNVSRQEGRSGRYRPELSAARMPADRTAGPGEGTDEKTSE